MAKPGIKWNIKGFQQLRKSRPVMSDLIRRGRAIQEGCGPDYEVTPFTGKTRARVSVAAHEPEAIRDNAKNQTLLKNLDRGR